MVKLNKEQFIDEIVGKLERIYGHENVHREPHDRGHGKARHPGLLLTLHLTAHS